MYAWSTMYYYLTNLARWHVLIGMSIAYVIYYFTHVVKRPLLACSEGPFKDFLQRKIPTLDTKYWPTFWCVEGRAQTVLASLLRAQILPNINYRREILTLSDGGEVALDWMEENRDGDTPCIILLPGLTGESQDAYVKCLVMAAHNAGMRVVVFNNRGLGGMAVKTMRMYCASNCDDLREVVQHVRNSLPTHCKLGAAGISMGGLVLGKYLGRHSEEARNYLTAAKIISVPWNVHRGISNIEKPILNSLLGRHLASGLCRTLGTAEIYRDAHLDMESILACKTIREFDALFTAREFGYADVDDYYSDASLHDKLNHISVPLLCLSAADDPIQPYDAIPIKAAYECANVAIIVTARGGHIGFLEGCWPSSKDQYMGRIFAEYFTTALLDEDGEFERTREQLLARIVSDVKNSEM